MSDSRQDTPQTGRPSPEGAAQSQNERPSPEGAAQSQNERPSPEGAAHDAARERAAAQQGGRPVTEAGPHHAPHADRPPAATGAAQQSAGPKPKPPYTAHPPKPAGAVRSETAFTDADVPPARGPEELDPEIALAEDAAAVPDKAAEYLELAQRTRAELDNFRKRAARDAAAAADRGVAKLAKELLPAFDHLDLALQHAEDDSELAKGIRLVQDEIRNALGRVGIQPFAPAGEVFDPNEHEAVAQLPVEGAQSGTVTEVYQQGYRINGTVLRPARVVVAQ
jgi:molecular chaperone GrpE